MSQQVARLIEVMGRLRTDCPWDAEQTHSSLVTYLVEETCEVVDAIECGTDEDLREELGDLLLQVIFHSEIAAEEGRFTIDDVAAGIADKLIRRHPYVFGDQDTPDDVLGSWETRKRAEKSRSSSLDGIPYRLSAVARAQKVVSRTRSHGVDVGLPADPVTADEVGARIVDLVARAQASGIDAEQAVRATLRQVENTVVDAEQS